MCKVLKVTRSGYYAWRNRPLNSQERANQALLEQIQAVFSHSRKTYGGPRIYAALRRQGITCGHNRVARLMRLHGIAAWRRRRTFNDRPCICNFSTYIPLKMLIPIVEVHPG